MATKPPSQVKAFASETLEKIAYNSVSTIPTQEPNDRNRLGYHIWQWLLNRRGTLESVIKVSGSRMHISQREALKTIEESLKKEGIQL